MLRTAIREADRGRNNGQWIIDNEGRDRKLRVTSYEEGELGSLCVYVFLCWGGEGDLRMGNPVGVWLLFFNFFVKLTLLSG